MPKRQAPYYQHASQSTEGSTGQAGPSGSQDSIVANNRVFGRLISYASVTSASGQKAYYWIQSQPAANGAWADDSYGLACTAVASGQQTGYAWEVNGTSTLTANSIVELEYMGGVLDARGESWRIVLSSQGASSFTLAGRTGTQTISSGDTMTLANGVVTATDTWTPDTASASLAGIVSTGTQTFAGDKSFLGDVVVNSGVSTGNTLAVYGASGDTDPVLQTGVSGVLNAGVTLGGTTDKSSLNVYGQITHENNFTQVGNADHSLIHAYLSSDGTGNKAAALADGDYSTTLFINYQQSANTAFIQFGRGDPLGGAGSKDYPCFFRLGGSATGSSVQPRYEIQDTALVTHLGATGTSGGGDTVKGGIVTALGSALTGFTDELAQDAVGTILVDSSTIDFTYNDGTPSITAAAIYQMSITADASGLKLSGDSASPGNSYYYGTNGAGTKGYYTLPQAADVGALTDSTGGTANTTLVAIAGTGDDTNLNDNFADLVAQINALRTALRNAGLMA